MSEYATLKRRPILFPDSVSSFHDSIFSLKEELKALVADDLQNKDAYVQTAVEIAIDLRSALADWTLTKLVDDDTRVAASEDLLAFAEGFGCGEAVKAARQEIESIANSSMRKMGDLYRQGKLNTVWGHDYASGLDHSLRRGARWCTSNPCKIQGYKKDFPEKYASLVEQISARIPAPLPPTWHPRCSPRSAPSAPGPWLPFMRPPTASTALCACRSTPARSATPRP